MVSKKSSSIPFVSVIIPTFNAERHVKRTLGELEDQNYPDDCYEIIVVDNESQDATLNLLKQFDVEVFTNRLAKNPYVSRNIGIKAAKGDIVAFLDITCTPDRDWLSEGVKLLNNGADLVGGNIEFTFSDSPSLGEWYDSITYVNVKKYIKKYDGTVCGNLFVKRSVCEAIGLFPEDGRSGMDIFWTRKATGKGFELVFGEKAVAYYPARNLTGVLSKACRVGKGHIDTWSKEDKSIGYMSWETFKTYSPPSFSDVRTNIKERGKPYMNAYILQLWGISWLYKVAMAWGRTIGIFRLRRKEQ